MGTTAAKLQAILDSKADIKAAIEEKGVTVGDAVLADYGDKIREIQTGSDTSTTSESYCVGRWPHWEEDESTAVRVDGDVSVALDWYPVLVDMSPVEGEVRKRPVGWLKRNNFLRFEDGCFAPTVVINETQRAACDVALYLDADHTQQYCDAGEFDAAAFYNQYGMTQKLYDADGNEVRILRPWETVETKYSIFIARKDTVRLLDHEQGADGLQLNGIVADDGKVDGILSEHVLPPTGIAADSCTQLADKSLRCIFFQYPTGVTGCNGLSPVNGIEGTGELFYGDGTYPRVLDNDREGANGYYANDDDKGVNQAKNAKYARLCNYDASKPYPVAEGGYHAWNVFVTCMEAAYGTKDLSAAARFGGGISYNYAATNEATFLAYGGIRMKPQGGTTWTYNRWGGNNTIIRVTAAAAATDSSNMVNRYAPKMWCMEAQMALSMAAELQVAPGVDFDFYGKTYHYATPNGATSLLNGRMNARLYRVRKMTLDAWNTSRVATTFDVECSLVAPICEGMNLCGDIYVYGGGGIECIHYQHDGYKVETFLEEDQTKWHDILHTVQHAGRYPFMDTYKSLGVIGGIGTSGYCMLRQPYGFWHEAPGSNGNNGECFYQYVASLGTAANTYYRCGYRRRGSAHALFASPRFVSAIFLASYCIATNGASAQVLIDVGGEGATAALPQ